MRCMLRNVGAVLLSALATAVFAQTDCTPVRGGGYSCFDYSRGQATDITPRRGGGYTIERY